MPKDHQGQYPRPDKAAQARADAEDHRDMHEPPPYPARKLDWPPLAQQPETD